MDTNENGQKWTGLTVECLHCGASKEATRQQIRRDDEIMPMEVCHADDCTARLCPSCPQFCCDACGLAHCLGHAVVIDGIQFCQVCVTGELADQEEAALVVAMAELAQEDAAIMVGAGLTMAECRAMLEQEGRLAN